MMFAKNNLNKGFFVTYDLITNTEGITLDQQTSKTLRTLKDAQEYLKDLEDFSTQKRILPLGYKIRNIKIFKFEKVDEKSLS